MTPVKCCRSYTFEITGMGKVYGVSSDIWRHQITQETQYMVNIDWNVHRFENGEK